MTEMSAAQRRRAESVALAVKALRLNGSSHWTAVGVESEILVAAAAIDSFIEKGKQ